MESILAVNSSTKKPSLGGEVGKARIFWRTDGGFGVLSQRFMIKFVAARCNKPG
jgi:hypothetical protein